MASKLILIVLFGASVLAGKPPERAPKAAGAHSSHSNFTYGYSLPGKNDAHQEQFEHRDGKHVEGSFAVHLPDGQSVSDVEYTADERGFHPIVRLSTKTNHSQVTSHFALGQSAVKRLGEQNEKSLESTSESKDSPSVTDLIAKYGGKSLDDFKVEKTDRKTPIKYDSKNSDDTIQQVLTSLFPDGIPKKYEELLNTTDDINIETKMDYPLLPTYVSEKAEEVEVTTKSFIKPTQETKIRRGLNTERYEDSEKISPKKKTKTYQHLVSDEEVLQINDAAENYTEEDEGGTQMLPTVQQVPVYEVFPEEQRGSFGDLHPFEAPIVVEEQNDNLFASSSGNNENYVTLPSKEIRIAPSRERYVSSQKYDPERRINLQILNSGNGFKHAILRAATAKDLDAFQKIVEGSFSYSPEYRTEAPSRAFLRELDQKFIKHTSLPIEREDRHKSFEEPKSKQGNKQQFEEKSENRNYETREDSREKIEDEQRYEDVETHLEPKYENKPNRYKNLITPSSEEERRNENKESPSTEKLRQIPKQLFTPHIPNEDDEDDEEPHPPPRSLNSERPREKTFVEIAKAVNIQNLLIKEDEDSIERHEEYLQPLAFGDRLTHRIESKFMKAKPMSHYYQQSPVSDNRLTLIPVTIRPSISYALAPEHIEYHPPEYHEFQQYDDVQQNPQHHQQMQEIPQHQQEPIQSDQQQHSEGPNQNFSEDSEEKDVEESRHISKLHTKVSYNDIEDYPEKFKSDSFRHSVAAPIIHPKYFPRQPEIVEKIITKPVKIPFPVKEYVEKIIEKPVHIEKIIDRPVPVPYYVAVDRIVETPIHVPYPVEHVVAVEKLVATEVPVPVEKFVDRPVPVPVEKVVEKIVKMPVPVHIPVKIPVPVHVPVKITIPNTYLTSQITTQAVPQQPYVAPTKQNTLQELQKALESVYSQPVIVQQQISDVNTMIKNQQLWPIKQALMNRHPKQISENEFQQNSGNIKDDYYGPVPLQSEYSHWGGQNFKRSSDFGRNLRMEYGFKPPLIPSIEIDDQGMPVNRKNDS